MIHPLSTELQGLLAEYVMARKQAEYRLTLLQEAERDSRNKDADWIMAKDKEDKALEALIRESGNAGEW